MFPATTNQWVAGADRDAALDTYASPDVWSRFADFLSAGGGRIEDCLRGQSGQARRRLQGPHRRAASGLQFMRPIRKLIDWS
jgi:hypothetical protein